MTLPAFLQNALANHESNGLDIIIALVLNDINPLGKHRIDLVLGLKVCIWALWNCLILIFFSLDNVNADVYLNIRASSFGLAVSRLYIIVEDVSKKVEQLYLYFTDIAKRLGFSFFNSKQSYQIKPEISHQYCDWIKSHNFSIYVHVQVELGLMSWKIWWSACLHVVGSVSYVENIYHIFTLYDLAPFSEPVAALDLLWVYESGQV